LSRVNFGPRLDSNTIIAILILDLAIKDIRATWRGPRCVAWAGAASKSPETLIFPKFGTLNPELRQEPTD
jgi:hypothetical protein